MSLSTLTSKGTDYYPQRMLGMFCNYTPGIRSNLWKMTDMKLYSSLLLKGLPMFLGF